MTPLEIVVANPDLYYDNECPELCRAFREQGYSGLILEDGLILNFEDLWPDTLIAWAVRDPDRFI
jgi:hypothetical protein